MRNTWSRLRRVAGVPSGLVVAAASAFYLLINAVTWEAGVLEGAAGVWGSAGVAVAVTCVLFARWNARVGAALAPTLDGPGSAKLAARRGAIVIAGLDSAEPGTTFLRLLGAADRLEYLALITTPQVVARGAVPALVQLVARAGRTLPYDRIRVWDDNEADAMADTEQSVTEAIAWMARRQLHPSEIVIDVTKGRRPMHFGALIAADRANVEVQYLAADWHHLDDRPRIGSSEFTVVHEHWADVGPRAALLEN